MESGITTVSYRVGQVRYVRETFISAVDDVLVVRLASSAPKGISGSVSLRRQKDMSVRAVGNDLLRMDGQIVDDDSPGAYDDNPGGSGPGGKHMRFAGRLYVDASSGDVVAENRSIRFADAGSVSLIFSAATDYSLEKLSFDRSIDPGKVAESLVEDARARSFDNIRHRHVAEHREMYNRVSIDLGGSERLAIPTDERLELMKDGGQDPALSAQLFQFGRYLLMSSSRGPGRLPANLQGIWNKEMWAPWEADYHMNINANELLADGCCKPGRNYRTVCRLVRACGREGRGNREDTLQFARVADVHDEQPLRKDVARRFGHVVPVCQWRARSATRRLDGTGVVETLRIYGR